MFSVLYACKMRSLLFALTIPTSIKHSHPLLIYVFFYSDYIFVSSGRSGTVWNSWSGWKRRTSCEYILKQIVARCFSGWTALKSKLLNNTRQHLSRETREEYSLFLSFNTTHQFGWIMTWFKVLLLVKSLHLDWGEEHFNVVWEKL